MKRDWADDARRAWVEYLMLPSCVRCGHPRYCHRWRESVRVLADPPVCHRYERLAPWWLRAATRLLGRRS